LSECIREVVCGIGRLHVRVPTRACACACACACA
jgi:hypothetical protein